MRRDVDLYGVVEDCSHLVHLWRTGLKEDSKAAAIGIYEVDNVAI